MKTKLMGLRVDPKERELWVLAARAEGVLLSDWIRQVLTQEAEDILEVLTVTEGEREAE
jgi:uncharacterized protein (DUF1778 family)